MLIVESLVGGLIESVVSSVFEQLFSADKELATRLKSIQQELRSKETDVKSILQKASTSLAKAVSANHPNSERLKQFLVSPEVEALMRQIFSTQLVHSETQSVLMIRDEFTRILGLYTAAPQDATAISDILFPALIDACSMQIRYTISCGNIAPSALTEITNSKMLLDELATVGPNMKLLEKGVSLTGIEEFETKYRRQVGVATRFIIPPDTEQVRKLPIDDLYVPSDFVLRPNRSDQPIRTIGMDELLKSAYRIVILGNPGGGKSTFVRKLSHDLATRYDARLFAGRRLTPIFITLREYGAEKKTRGCSILEFLEMKARSEYQLPMVPEHAFDYLFLNGRVLVLFDGLDELLDTTDRQKISQDVEMFASLYPSAPIVVTSREVGYEQAPLDERFQIVRLGSFNTNQTETYAGKWFAVNTDLTAIQRQQAVAAFMRDSSIVADLRSNPLMLALMCILYRGDGYIPKNRPDVYKRCAEMLFEKWDKGRGIHYMLPFESHIRPAMHHLASWIYSSEALQNGVSEESLVAEATDYLHRWCYEDTQDATVAARAFIEFCRGRAWVFTDTGTKRGGERLYQFTHRTFLEYFTAVHLVHTHRTPEDLVLLLLPHIKLREWDTVAQLSFQLKASGFEGDGDQLLTRLVESADRENGPPKINILSFAAAALHYLVPTPTLRRLIVRRCFLGLIDEAIRHDNTPEQEPPEIMVANLLSAARENQQTVREELVNVACAEIESLNRERAILAAEISLQFQFLALLSGTAPGTAESWGQVSDAVAEKRADCLVQLAAEDLGIAVLCLWRGLIQIPSFVASHGIPSLFYGCGFRTLRAGVAATAPAELHNLLGRYQLKADYVERSERHFEDIGELVWRVPTPWLDLNAKPEETVRLWDVPPAEVQGGVQRTLNPKALFGVFVTLAVIVEASGSPEMMLRMVARAARTDEIRNLASTMLLRCGGEASVNIVDGCACFSGDQRKFVEAWLGKRINLVTQIVR